MKEALAAILLRWLPAIACVLVALDCAEKAMGIHAQLLYTPDWLWLWWISGSGWLLIGIARVFIR